MPVRTAEHFLCRLLDGSGNSIEVGPGAGEHSLPDLEADDREHFPIYDREDYQEAVYGRKKTYEWSLEIYQDGPFTSASEQTVLDFVRGTGAYASGSATVDPGGVVRMLHVEIVETYGATVTTTRLSCCRVRASHSISMEGNRLALSGTCYQGVSHPA